MNTNKLRILNAIHSFSDSKYANFINSLKTTDGFSQNKHKTFFCCLEGSNKKFNNKNFIKKIYNLHKNTQIILIKIRLYKVMGALKLYFLQRYFLKKEYKILVQNIKPDLIYTRSFLLAKISMENKIPVILESHASPIKRNIEMADFTSKFSKNKYLKKIITIHPILKNGFIKRGIPKNKIQVVLDAADNNTFKIKKNKTKFFEVFYMGSFFEYKGVYTILRSAKILKNIKFTLVGGSGAELDRVKKFVYLNNLENVSILPWVTMNKLPKLITKAKILLLFPERYDPSSKWTSPIKLNEYLSTGIPLICSNIPSLKYCLNESLVTFSKAGDEKMLAETINKIKLHYSNFVNKAKKGISYSKKNSYKKRSQKILKKI